MTNDRYRGFIRTLIYYDQSFKEGFLCNDFFNCVYFEQVVNFNVAKIKATCNKIEICV